MNKENNIHFFTNWLSDHKKVKKEGNWLYLPFPQEHIPNVGYATGGQMYKYWEENKTAILPTMGVAITDENGFVDN